MIFQTNVPDLMTPYYNKRYKKTLELLASRIKKDMDKFLLKTNTIEFYKEYDVKTKLVIITIEKDESN